MSATKTEELLGWVLSRALFEQEVWTVQFYAPDRDAAPVWPGAFIVQ